MKRLAPIIVVLLVYAWPVSAEPPLGEASFRQALLDLGTDLRLMCVAAHPDDEDGATLAMYRKHYGYHTIAVLATKGEGGQNEIGPELYDDLAVIRTHEMAGAAAVEGAELHFLNYPEFGYSKSLEEAMTVWGHDWALERMVRVIRETRPDVIISNHGSMTDHGHHQAVGALLREAFDGAGDPAIFPEHADGGLAPWQPARLYLRSWRETGRDVTVDISTLDPWRGLTYAEIAAEALSVHKSQGMEFFIRRYLTGRPKGASAAWWTAVACRRRVVFCSTG
jgi:LmbE family N-acetylglucosaminyl deacetylase